MCALNPIRTNSNHAWSQLRSVLVVGGLVLSSSAYAMEFKGQLRVGAFTRTVSLSEQAGESSNDEYIMSGQVHLEAYELNGDNDQIILEARDKVDNFGKLERENLRLTTYNRMQLRTFAYQRPFEFNKTYFSLGRFSLPEANLLVHDGLEVGYRFSKNTRAGFYAGLGPKDILTPLYVDPLSERSSSGLQAGAYVTYDRKEGAEDSSYLTQGFGKAPTYDLTDAEDHMSYFQQGLWTFSAANRLSSLVLFDVQPASKLRRGSLAYTYLSENLRTTASVQQTDTEDYLLKQEVQDALLPSAVQSVALDVRQRTSSHLSFDYLLRYGRRAADSLTQDELGVGILKHEFLGKSDSVRFQLALRRNFTSRDRIYRLAYDYWSRSLSIGLSHVMTQLSYDSGRNDTRQDTSLDAGFFLSDKLRGSLGIQREADSLVSANALFFMVGYRFGGGSASPVRQKPALFESM